MMPLLKIRDLDSSFWLCMSHVFDYTLVNQAARKRADDLHKYFEIAHNSQTYRACVNCYYLR